MGKKHLNILRKNKDFLIEELKEFYIIKKIVELFNNFIQSDKKHSKQEVFGILFKNITNILILFLGIGLGTQILILFSIGNYTFDYFIYFSITNLGIDSIGFITYFIFPFFYLIYVILFIKILFYFSHSKDENIILFILFISLFILFFFTFSPEGFFAETTFLLYIINFFILVGTLIFTILYSFKIYSLKTFLGILMIPISRILSSLSNNLLFNFSEKSGDIKFVLQFIFLIGIISLFIRMLFLVDLKKEKNIFFKDLNKKFKTNQPNELSFYKSCLIFINITTFVVLTYGYNLCLEKFSKQYIKMNNKCEQIEYFNDKYVFTKDNVYKTENQSITFLKVCETK